MAEELRFFLRTALYAAAIAVIYWFASHDPVTGGYDWAGTTVLAAAALATGAIVAVAGAFARRALHGEGGTVLETAVHWIGLTDPGGAADDQPLSVGLDPLPRSSSWPVLAGLAATLVALGLVFGPWLLLPGVALLALSIWGWVTQLRG
ncbi:MAG TPA: cytochrome c oxidase subunit 4 [candidate division Zixibacteria bacterium]|nr:cytochrome c oxidase subunit 4 [candidate division Zixibacteria bacterium]